jgi:RNA polymerase primary sigma factor
VHSFAPQFLFRAPHRPSNYDQTQKGTCPVSRLYMAAGNSPGAFNPFQTRQKNSRIQWFESGLNEFYNFVEDQPMLTQEQELNYGKALQIWLKTENIRDKLYREKIRKHRALRFKQMRDEDLLDGLNIEGDDVDIANNNEDNNNFENGKEINFDVSRSVLSPVSYEHVTISDAELAEALDCSVEKIEKIAKYQEVAMNRLVNSNLKLVLAVVSRYRSMAIPNVELIAEGTRGLSRAAMRYDYSKGFRFATYATWYVHQAVYEYVRWKKHPAKMPSRYLQLQRKVKEYEKIFLKDNGRMPNPDELAIALQQSRFDIAKVQAMQIYPILLYSPLASKSSTTSSISNRERTYEEFVQTKDFLPPDAVAYSGLREELEIMMDENLNKVEKDVLRERLGLESGRPKAVKEIGRKFKISWKDVRNVEKEAMNKLKQSKEMSGFIENFEGVSVGSSFVG